MKRWLVVAALLVAGCSGSSQKAATPTKAAVETTTPSTVTVDPLPADKKLIVALWRHLSDAWGSGTPPEIDAGFAAEADTSHPDAKVDAAACKAKLIRDASKVTSLKLEHIVDQATIQPDDGWVVPGGVGNGVVPRGRIYIMTVKTTVYANVAGPQPSENELHAAVLDGVAYQFPNC